MARSSVITKLVARDAPLWRLGLVAFVFSLIVNVIVLYLVRTRVPFFEPLQLPNVLVWTVGSVIGATFTYRYILKRSANPPRAFIKVALIVLIVSFVPNLAFFWIEPGPVLGTPTAGGILTLMFMHVVVAVFVVPLLIRYDASMHKSKPLVKRGFRRSPLVISGAAILALAIVIVAKLALGNLLMILFASGFVIGFLLWIGLPSLAQFSDIKIPYILTWVFFAAHLTEEHFTHYMPTLLALFGAPAPQKGSVLGTCLLAIPLSWLAVPYLVNREYAFGHYLAWAFFASMGITESAHFFYPFFREGPYRYFPGMWTMFLLAPTAWWGMRCLARPRAAGRF